MGSERGFTLIEAIVVIVVTGIIGGVVAVFIRAPVEAYFDVQRRGQLSDSADAALRRIGRDLRLAVPNSVRVSGNFLEYLPASDGGRYRALPNAAGGGDFLDFASAADNSFAVLGPAVSGSAGDYLVIFNTGQCSVAGCAAACSAADPGLNAYQGCNRRTLSAAAGGTVSFTATANPIPFDSPGHRFQIIPTTGPVTYGCVGVGTAGGTGTGTLTRYTGYAAAGGNWSVQPAPPAVAGTTLVDAVSACTITYTAGVTARSGLVSVHLTLTRSNESVSLYHEVHVDNQP